MFKSFPQMWSNITNAVWKRAIQHTDYMIGLSQKKTYAAIPVEEGKGLFDSMQIWYCVFGTLEMGMGDNESE